jgi:NADH-quinone oxidoreductase subunit M
MNIIYLAMCWGDSFSINSVILFSATHAFLSALMFFLVDCIYRRYFTRSIIEVQGILQYTPNLSAVVILMVIFFAGLPGTLKFLVEFYIFSGVLDVSPVIACLLILVCNVIGLIGFTKN